MDSARGVGSWILNGNVGWRWGLASLLWARTVENDIKEKKQNSCIEGILIPHIFIEQRPPFLLFTYIHRY